MSLVSFDECMEFTKVNPSKAVASAADPFGEGDSAWWKDVDHPFLALARASSSNACSSCGLEQYMSDNPIHHADTPHGP